MNVKELEDMARLIRKDVIEMVFDVKDGHPGASYSATDIITALYFGGVMNIDPENPQWEERDRFILSKGHACPALYAALIRKGIIPEKEKFTLRKISSILQGHPDMIKTPGIEATTGPLGNGLAMGVGMAKAFKIQKKNCCVFVLTGDGELQEGIIWEALQAAVKNELDNLTILIDNNRRQSGGLITEVSGIHPLKEKFEAFQTYCQVIEGHNFTEIINSLKKAESSTQPSVIICKTIKGKGIDFMEEDNSWHKRTPSKEEFKNAISQLDRSR